MSKSPSSIPGVEAMATTFDFFKNMWSGMPGMNLPGMNLPSMVMPSLSVDEIERQIKDLKAVESWLSLNLSMLQGTIQALEVQKATIATIQTMGESFSAAMQSSAPPKTTEPTSKSGFDSPFGKSVPTPAAEAAGPGEAGGEQPNMIPPMANPAVWWNMLQDQFKQAVDTAAAMGTEAAEAVASQKAEEPAAPRKRKTTPKE